MPRDGGDAPRQPEPDRAGLDVEPRRISIGPASRRTLLATIVAAAAQPHDDWGTRVIVVPACDRPPGYVALPGRRTRRRTLPARARASSGPALAYELCVG